MKGATMKIVAVCGMGIGTSILLKMNAEKVLAKLGIDADVEAADIGVAKGAAQTAQVVLTSDELATELGQVPAKVIIIDNFFDLDEIESKLTEAVQ
jgi:PTS system ascorbate-specific IIB component